MHKLVVFMIDALCSYDIEQMKELPGFRDIIKRGSYVHHMHTVWPALTYCCHTSIVTGTYCNRHSIINNEKMKRGYTVEMQDNYGHITDEDLRTADMKGKLSCWYSKKKDVRDPTILDYARENGLTTCSIAWPVSAGADYTYNWPMLVPYHYEGEHPECWLGNGNMTQNLMDRYFWRYSRFQKGMLASLDDLTMSIAPDIIEDFGQPDVMFIKMCDLDSARHAYGVYSQEAKDQLVKHAYEFETIMEAIKRFGDPDDTNYVIIGDHGQTDLTHVFNMNKALKDAGFIEISPEGKLVSYRAIAHSAALTCYITLQDPDDEKTKAEVRTFLEALKDDPLLKLRYVYDREQANEVYHVDGSFDFICESSNPVSFSDRLAGEDLWMKIEPGSHKYGVATHGGSPEREENTLFIAAGPSVRTGVVIEHGNMVDEAVTMAAMTGFEMPGTDGKIMEELLYESHN
ncbi:MAG: alkaline phosphatase family protein [Erysipelotrichaceae bacterium]|nr:alkaline phosphatase family protein [Erysipelotrichaceae bacterium]